jgi:hypothetical protein
MEEQKPDTSNAPEPLIPPEGAGETAPPELLTQGPPPAPLALQVDDAPTIIS